MESGFLAAMAQFDAFVANGESTQADRQNGKGDYFNDLVALLIMAASERTLVSRRNVDGRIFKNHNLDVTYPGKGIAEVLVETKMLGTPKHPGSKKQKAVGRDGSADYLKRAKELAFKAVDIKAGFGLVISEQGGYQAPLAGDLATWSRSSKPKTYYLMAVRVTGNADLQACIKTSLELAEVLDGVGLFAYTNDHLAKPAESYVAASFRGPGIPQNLQLGPVLHTIVNILSSLPQADVAPSGDVTPLPITGSLPSRT